MAWQVRCSSSSLAMLMRRLLRRGWSLERTAMAWGSWLAEVLTGSLLIGWGILMRYMNTRHSDALTAYGRPS